MPKKPNANRAETSQRISEVLRIRLDGAQWFDVRDYARGQGWKISDRQVFRLIARADREIMRHAEKDREALITRHVAQRRALLARAINAGDISTALRILDSECQLLGLFPKTPTAPPHPATPWSLDALTDEELALLKSAAERAGKVTLTQTTTTAELTMTERPTDEAEPTAPAGGNLQGSLPPPLPRVCPPDDDPV